MSTIVLGPDDPVKLVNLDDKAHTIKYDQTVYKLDAKATAYWPWKVACHLLGDPTLTDNPVFPDASEEWDRVRRNFGISATVNVKPEEWEERRAHVEVATMDGERIHMVIEGKKNEIDFSTGFSPDDMKVRIAQLEAQLSSLIANTQEEGSLVVTETAPNEEQVSDIADLPADGGTARSARRRS